MSSHNKSCPVCLMSVDAGSLETEFESMKFYFCSEQCQERFVANPHLYIGLAGKPSVKQQGECVIKQRILKLEQTIPDDVKEKIIESLSEMMGIKKVTITGKKISIVYDLIEVTAMQIENRIIKTGEKLTHRWAEQLKLAFIHYLEETELENLELNGSAGGCHNQKHD